MTLGRGISIALAIAVATLSASARAQSAYDTRPVTDLAITGVALGSFTALTFGLPKMRPPVRCEKEPCGPLGDGARPYNDTWNKVSYVPAMLLLGGAMAPPVTRAGEHGWEPVGDNVIVLSQAVGLTVLATELTKIVVPRYRPFLAYPAKGSDPWRQSRDATASYWSGHSALAFAAASIGSFDACRVDGALGCAVPAITFHGLAASTAFMRIMAGKHHVSDVLVGAAVGGAIGSFVAMTHAPKGREHGADAGRVMMGTHAFMLSTAWVW